MQRNNRLHNRQPLTPVRKFKGATVFEWDSEPAIERPTAANDSQTWGLSAVSGYPGLEVRRARPPQKRAGLSALWLGLIIVATVAAVGLFALLRWVHV